LGEGWRSNQERQERESNREQLAHNESFYGLGVVMPGISRACTKINAAGGLGGTTALGRACVVLSFFMDVT